MGARAPVADDRGASKALAPATKGPPVIRTTRTLAPLVVTLALSLGACGTTEIDPKKAEDLAVKALDPKPRSVECPSGVEAKTDATFRCQIAYDDGDKATLPMRVTNAEGRIETMGDQLDVTEIGSRHAEQVAREFAERSDVAVKTLSCPGAKATPGGDITCELEATDGSKASFKLRITADKNLEARPDSVEVSG
jgi:hypothetical protein